MYEAMIFDVSGERVMTARAGTIPEAVHLAHTWLDTAQQTAAATMSMHALALPDRPNRRLPDNDIPDAPLYVLWAYDRMTIPVGIVRRV